MTGATPLDAAAARFERAVDAVVDGDLDILADLLDRSPGLVAQRSHRPHRATLLHYSAANGVEDERQRTPSNAVEVAAALVAAGADINATAGFYGDGPGSTPLVGVVTSGHPNEAGLMVPLVRAFASSGQSLDGTDDDGLPMAMAFLFRHPHAARALADENARIDNVALAAGLGHLDMVQAGVRRGSPPRGRRDERTDADVGSRPTADPGGLKSFFGEPRTPTETVAVALTFAAIAGEHEVVRFLIEAGTDVDTRLTHGLTALHEAAWGGHREVVRSLMEAGAATDLRDSRFDATPAGWAAEAGHDDIVRILGGAPAADRATSVGNGQNSSTG